jgi:hypothetical protein
MNPIRFPDGLHGVIVVHPFGKYREADFLDDPEVIDALIADGEGWRFTDAVWLNDAPKDPEFSPGRIPADPR